jgi:hypothetical protein
MRSIPNSTRSTSSSKTLGEAGSFTEDIAGQDDYKAIVSKANSVPLTRLFKYYGLRLSESNQYIVCPFKSHKGGRENSASFKYYAPTNTYHCFGCKAGVDPVSFVMNMENISYSRAARKIVEEFSEDIDEGIVFEYENSSETLEIMADFSTHVREFREKFKSPEAFLYIEEVCKMFDDLNLRRNMDNEALKWIVDLLKMRIQAYDE